MHSSLRELLALAASGIACLGCVTPTPTRPIQSISYWSGIGEPKASVLLLPGRHSRASDFESAGFVQAVRKRNLNVEVVAVDAHLGYYAEQRYARLPDHIYEDVVKPLLSRGRSQLWVVGTSLGAFGTVAYVKYHPDAVRGMLLLGAYLGEQPVLDSIRQSGGLSQWEPTSSVGFAHENRAWKWLKGYVNHDVRPELYLGYGKADRFSLSSTLLEPALTSQHVLVDAEGGHDFPTWLRLWERFLDCCGHLLEPSAEKG
jgi:pimeloyl-ACP methyl ester carboxylesterase